MNDSIHETTTEVGGVIPHFFFDAIGRIVPGMYLATGMLLLSGGPALNYVKARIESGATGLVATFLFLLVVCYFIGFILGSLSFILVEKPWGMFRPWSMENLRDWYGLPAGEKSTLEDAFKIQFGWEIHQDKGKQEIEIARASQICAYFAWHMSFNLGIMASRWAAEALSARSISLGSLILLAYSLWVRDPWSVLTFFVIGLGALWAYAYHRKKDLLGDFDLFLACRSHRKP